MRHDPVGIACTGDGTHVGDGWWAAVRPPTSHEPLAPGRGYFSVTAQVPKISYSSPKLLSGSMLVTPAVVMSFSTAGLAITFTFTLPVAAFTNTQRLPATAPGFSTFPLQSVGIGSGSSGSPLAFRSSFS